LEDSLHARFEESLDSRSVGGKGYGLSKVISAKLGAIEELLRRPMPAPPAVEADSMNMLFGDI
jgi:hypothetical protein